MTVTMGKEAMSARLRSMLPQSPSGPMEDHDLMALEFTAEYGHLDSAGSVSLFSDYGAATLSDASATLVKDLALAGLLSKETALREMQRRGVLAAEVVPLEEIEKAATEGPALGELGGIAGDPADE